MSQQPVILIVTHNHKQFLGPLIESCIRLPHIKKYICDAASSDGTNEELKKLIADKSDFNLLSKNVLEGFSKNNNDLIHHYKLHNLPIILVNPDCSFSAQAFHKFVSIASSIENIGVAAPSLTYPNGTPQSSWRKFPTPYQFVNKRINKKLADPGNHTTHELHDSTYSIEWALGAFLYVSHELNTGSGILDERYRLYCEDPDICLTAHFRGKRVVGIPMEGIKHDLQQKSRAVFSKYSYWNIKSALLFALKWRGEYFNILKKIRSSTF
ncbi:glycosyltransferase [Pseudomonas sp. UW4]|uniref:glycosyltransferase n=1 Tax=Pseudomonas sp. UW4 TaxID=1207075 RepID=UPI00029D153A|nr:glycosyltransferase [Pseudomonas sp. UW4]AFY20737.1 glucosyltransferase [Pseudomonas sp. UW4]